ncbi:hypothetical protein OF83DRAFT_1179235 [Amylostereum chailletii]|nr:hypothetical protein OF83DRAFT_1179235 [Amylostereum chailletii]
MAHDDEIGIHLDRGGGREAQHNRADCIIVGVIPPLVLLAITSPTHWLHFRVLTPPRR